ncbi:hypothetical protein I7I53_03157 [Histoplasma capsulatum var. duboisii H88]|uniref:Uncharacterized protein n=1 Tax=Ajellomyces capsulatus (strain H88) TaxID=544711 RepID=A0A8A1LTK9_AJEC8|nr:hypothetical protein I7I53_03157 [Histoplasma capsulatum var. duboisii H88]
MTERKRVMEGEKEEREPNCNTTVRWKKRLERNGAEIYFNPVLFRVALSCTSLSRIWTTASPSLAHY